MENRKKTYWKGVEQLMNRPDFVKNNEKEFPSYLPIKDAYGDNTQEEGDGGMNTNRRDFLKLMGFSVAAVSLAACETPVRKAIPYLVKPEEVDPSVANYYASSYINGSDYCPVLVRTREGRPVHIEGNDFSSFSQGGVSARAQASIMSLYDMEKAQEPTKGGNNMSWEAIDSEIKDQLTIIAQSGAAIYIVANTIISPSTRQIIAEFTAKYPTAKLVMYDQVSQSGMIEANRAQFGKAAIPSYNFDKAEVIVSVGADFLGDWISSVEFAADYAKGRKVGKEKKSMSRHYQYETQLSITGSSADVRKAIRASQEGLVVAKLYNAVAGKLGGTAISATDVDVDVEKAAADLVAAKGRSLVVSGSNHMGVQALVNGINQMLDNYGHTIDMATPMFVKQGSDKAMSDFVNALSGNDAVIFYNCNPVYDFAEGAKLSAKVKEAKLSVATADRLDETASLCTYNCPDSHFLESWNDAEPKKGMFTLCQPTIRTIFNTRQVQDSLLKWMGSEVSYKDYLQNVWQVQLMALQAKETLGLKFWQRSLHDGVFEGATGSLMEKFVLGAVPTVEGVPATTTTTAFDMGQAASKVAQDFQAGNTGIELVVFSSPLMGWGHLANNPYLQETPEPISKVCWGNYVAVSQAKAKELGVEVFETKTHIAKVTANGVTMELPVIVQPGLQKDSIAIAMGYGREKAGKVAAQAGGANAFKLIGVKDGQVGYSVVSGVSIENTRQVTDVAQTQTHGTILGRETIIQETTLAAYKENPLAGAFRPTIATSKGDVRPNELTEWDVSSDGYGEEKLREGEASKKQPNPTLLWNDKVGFKADSFTYPTHHWGLAIDLNSCTGCSACVVACHTENNVPIVGKQEIINRREMHWLRIDRYYSSDGEAGDYKALEVASENPGVVFQPMMCQHCNNAPCETVCPVAATTHSSEGLNQMTYNRCIGTKYCANNCPFKVRRFNWFLYHDNSNFDYHMNNALGKMVLNPDVTVRSRGVMEKCSMCVQRIQAGKLTAKREGRKVKDGDASTACSKACPSQAIVFGDLNDETSAIRQMMDYELESRAYNVLEEINVRPNVWYLRKVRNTDEKQA